MTTTTMEQREKQNSSSTVKLINALTRKKDTSHVIVDQQPEKLARVLGLMDLTALGVGSTLGLGVYVLAGSVAKTDAGPAVVLSFFVAALASAFAALCYAEFASRVPQAGSAYIYSYVTVGEFAAFVIGWNLILEYAIGTASVAKGLSNYVDALLGHMMKNTMSKIFPIGVSFLAPYPDFFAAALVLLLTGLLCWGVKESTMVNNLFTVLNVVTVLTVIVTGFLKANFSNWQIPKSDIPEGFRGGQGGFVPFGWAGVFSGAAKCFYAFVGFDGIASAVNPSNWSVAKNDIPKTVARPGEGGFMPFGWAGIMSGAAKCFYGFIGFDVIASTGEEAKKPSKNIPLSIMISLIIVFLSYAGVAVVLTMLIPYYEQDMDAPLPHAFAAVDLSFIKWIVTCGAICALCASMLGAIFPLPRILYAMSCDGLILRIFSHIHPVTKTPVFGTFISGSLAGLMAGIFNLEQLIDMMSIGTLLAYSVVAICVLILRYEKESMEIKEIAEFSPNKETEPAMPHIFVAFKQYTNLYGLKYPTEQTEKISRVGIFLFCIFSLLLCFTFIYGDKLLFNTEVYNAACIVLLVLLICSFLIICRQPQLNPLLAFKVPAVPLIPCCSIISNIFLMMKLDIDTWIRFGVWIIFGMLTYMFYSIDHSVQGIRNKMATNVNIVPMDSKQVQKNDSA